jgi:hypothetical protein
MEEVILHLVNAMLGARRTHNSMLVQHIVTYIGG